MSVEPKITVLMSVYNEDNEYLSIAIESILSQTFSDFEFLIVDDGTCEENWKILDRFQALDSRIRIIRNQENMGLTKSLNVGLRNARGEYIARMDSDDVSRPERLAKQLDYAITRPNAIVVGGLAKVIGERRMILPFIEDSRVMKIRMLFYNCALAHPTAFMAKRMLDEKRIEYNEHLRRAQDYMLWADCLSEGEIAVMPEVVLYYRVHEKQISNKFVDDQIESSMVAQRKLYKFYFGEDISDELMRAHSLLIKGRIETSIAEINQHFDRMRELNSALQVFDEQLFRQELLYIWFLMTIRSLKNHRDFRALFSKYMIQAAFSSYVWRNIFSIKSGVSHVKHA